MTGKSPSDRSQLNSENLIINVLANPNPQPTPHISPLLTPSPYTLSFLGTSHLIAPIPNPNTPPPPVSQPPPRSNTPPSPSRAPQTAPCAPLPATPLLPASRPASSRHPRPPPSAPLENWRSSRCRQIRRPASLWRRILSVGRLGWLGSSGAGGSSKDVGGRRGRILWTFGWGGSGGWW